MLSFSDYSIRTNKSVDEDANVHWASVEPLGHASHCTVCCGCGSPLLPDLHQGCPAGVCY